ncbi:MAG TPA: glycosyltransferase family 4 protein [Candidatus Acidoferrales bacterium]|nr:glycosyltransferase family 4 protein [Candidatus Acidoferrales bacterium]
MHFLILTQYFPPEMGAAQVRLGVLVRELQKNGHSVEVVTAIPRHVVGPRLAAKQRGIYARDLYFGAVVHRTWVYPGTGFGARRLMGYLSFTFSSFLGLARSKRPDFLIVESPPLFLGLSAWLYGIFRRVPFIFYVADLWPESVRAIGVIKDGMLFKLAEQLERFIYERAKYIAAATAGILSTLTSKKRVAPSKVFFLPNGVDTHAITPVTRDEALLDELGLRGKSVFLYAGNHGAVAGLETLVRTAKLLERSNSVILFVGDGQEKPDLVRLASAQGLGNVRFVGAKPVEEMPRYHSIALATIVHVRKGDLFKATRPAKLFTSLACGVPAIYCGEGEAADLVRQEGVGLVVPPEEPAELAKAIETLEAQPRLRADMAVKARVLAEREFGWDLIISRWLDQLRDAEAADRSKPPALSSAVERAS